MTMDRIESILSTLVAFDTTSRNSNLALVDWAQDLLESCGFACTRLPDPSGLKANLWATIGPADVAGYVLSGHTDVVPVDGQDWSSDPFTLVKRDGRYYGRGACDMKGFVAVCLAAAEEAARRPLARPLHLALSYDEEVGCVGGRLLAEWLALQPVRPLACFVGEPTEMGVVIGHKGKRSIKAEIHGRSVHSSLAPQGVNAVEYGAMLAAEVARLARELREQGPRDPLYDVPFSTAHVGILRGGTALNIVADHCEMVFEVRCIGAHDPDALVDRLRAYARDVLEPAMKAVDPASGIDFTVYAGFPGLDTAPDAEVTTLAKTLAGRNDHSKVAYGTEAGLFATIAEIPTIIIGPGSITQAHTPDEWIAVSELESCAEFVRRVVERCADG
jgi:acetylornithine deacetylase